MKIVILINLMEIIAQNNCSLIIYLTAIITITIVIIITTTMRITKFMLMKMFIKNTAKKAQNIIKRTLILLFIR